MQGSGSKPCMRLGLSKFARAWLMRAVGVACCVAATQQVSEGLQTYTRLQEREAQVLALIAEGDGAPCGFISASLVHGVRVAALRAVLLVAFAVPMLAPSRRVLAGTLAAVAVCIAAFGTTDGWPPNVSLGSDAQALVFACMVSVASIAVAPATDFTNRARRCGVRVGVGAVLAGLSALQATSLPGSARYANDRVAVVFLLGPTAVALLASAVAVHRGRQPDILYRGLPLLTLTTLLTIAIQLGRL